MNYNIKNIPNLAQQSLHYCSQNYCIDCSRFHCSSFSRNHCTSCSCLHSEYERKHLVPYLKQFIGYQQYKDGKEKRKKFYDEREWRYIPDNSLVELYFGTKAQQERTEAKQNGDRMKLDLNEVEYIIIEKEADFDRMIKELRTIADNYEKLKFESLIAKIMTSKQIERDF